MLAIYLFSLIVGGGLLLFSALAAGDGEGSEVHDAPDHHVEAHVDGGTLFQEFFSVRAFLYFLAGFGATGLLMETLTPAPAGVAAAWAVATGLVAATAAGAAYGWLRRSESGLVPLDGGHLVGLAARVVLPVEAGHRGKVLAVYDGREIELLARLFSPEDGACPRGSTVVIVDLEGETALVTPIPHLPSELA